jgi:hypothetical protein
MSSDINLYFNVRDTINQVANVGRLLLHDVEPDAPNAASLRLRIEFFPVQSEDDGRYWVALDAIASTQLEPRLQVGRIVVDPKQQPAFPPTPTSRSTNVLWSWHFLPSDIEIVELARSQQPDHPIYLRLEVAGVAQTSSGAIGVNGEGSVKIELSQWHRLLEGMGYSVSPSGIAALGSANLDHHAWRDAAARLEMAREHLRRGEDYAALEACLSQLEAVVTAPFKADSWSSKTADMPDQKSGSIAAWLSGLATYLNRVGHHRSRSERDADGDLTEMPLDHWEAELAVASTQVALAYVIRL